MPGNSANTTFCCTAIQISLDPAVCRKLATCAIASGPETPGGAYGTMCDRSVMSICPACANNRDKLLLGRSAA